MIKPHTFVVNKVHMVPWGPHAKFLPGWSSVKFFPCKTTSYGRRFVKPHPCYTQSITCSPYAKFQADWSFNLLLAVKELPVVNNLYSVTWRPHAKFQPN